MSQTEIATEVDRIATDIVARHAARIDKQGDFPAEAITRPT